MRVLGVARVSTKEQSTDDHFSLGAQAERIRGYCVAHGWELVDLYSYVKSGGSNRKELEHILHRVKAERIEAVVVNELDRLARDMVTTLLFLEDLKAAGARFASVSDDLDLTTPEGELHMQILAMFAAYFRKQLSRKVKMGQAQRAAAGKRHGARPYGYQPDGPSWAIDPTEAAIVRQVYAWYLDEGLGFRAIAQRLNAAGTPSQKGLQHAWDARTVERMLRREAYAGDLIYGKWIQHRERDGSVRQERRAPSVVRDTHPAIIPRDRWEATQARLTARSALGHTPLHGPYLLSGLVRCGVCGTSMVVVHRTHGSPGARTRIPRYLCRAYHTKGLCSPTSSIALAALEAAVLAALERLRAVASQGVIADADVQRWMADDPAVAGAADRRKQARDRLRQIDPMLARAEEAMLAGAYTIARYQATCARLETDRVRWQAEAAAPMAPVDPRQIAARVDALIATFRAGQAAPDKAPYRGLLAELIREIRCAPGGQITLAFRADPPENAPVT